MSGWFGALVGAPTALDAETTPPKCGEASMMKKGLAEILKDGSIGRVYLAVLRLWWGPLGPWMQKLPLPDVDEI